MRRIAYCPLLTFVAVICALAADIVSPVSAAVFVEDAFEGTSGASPDAARFDWSGQLGLNGAGQLNLSTDTANTSWIKSKTGASLAPGQTLVLTFTAYAYAENWNPGVYGDKQPRGLRYGTDANNVLEFYSAARTTVGIRARLNGAETLLSYALPSGVDSMHQYEISVTTTAAVFRIDGVLAGTITSNIPTNSLNFHVSTYDGGAGNVPVTIDAMQLSLVSGQVPPGIASQPGNQTVSVGDTASFTVTATGTEPLACQWYKEGAGLPDGGNVSGAMSTNLVLASVQTNDAGNYAVVITNASGCVTSSIATLTVNRLAQTIAFGALPGKRVDDAPFSLHAQASSGLTVSYSSSNTNVAIVNGNLITIAGVGATTITASQAGNASYLPATDVGQTLVVSSLAAGSDLLFKQAAAGVLYTVAIKSDGTLWTCGANTYGQLGDGTTNNRTNLVQIGSEADWQSVSAWRFHTMAIKTNGTLWAWGYNAAGQLGDGTTNNKSSPVQIGSATNWRSVSAGYNFTIAVKADGTLWAWGWNISSGYSTDIITSPVQIGTAANWRSASAGFNHALITRTDGTLWARGLNLYGQLGLGYQGGISSLVQVGSATNWLSASAGNQFSGAVKTDGTLWMWGAGLDGQLGDGVWDSQFSPVRIGSATNWQSVSTGYYEAFAIRTDGTLWDSYGSYSQVGSATDWQSVWAGTMHNVAIKTDGTLWAWGNNSYGQLGDGTTVVQNAPFKIGAPAILVQPATLLSPRGVAARFSVTAAGSAPLAYQWRKDGADLVDGGNLSGAAAANLVIAGSQPSENGAYSVVVTNAYGSVTSSVANLTVTDLAFRQVEAGDSHTVAIRTDGTLWVWGYNGNGQLGNGTLTSTNNPVQVGSATDWQSVAAGYSHTLGLKNNGTLWAWGYNNYGQLGIGTQITTNIPVRVGSDVDWQAVVAGNYHTLGLKSNGSLWAWGYNNYGQLGLGTQTATNIPVQVGSDLDWRMVTAGGQHTLAIKTDGTLWAWGYNSYGQLGNGTQTATNLPVQVGSDTDWRMAVAGAQHTLAIKTDGTLWAWGQNGYGQLGDGTTVNEFSPVQIGSANDWQSVAAGAQHTLAIKTDGTLWAWGYNYQGQLGDGTAVNKSSPVQIGSASDWQSVAAGTYYTVAVKSDGTVWTWGQNGDGQLGDGSKAGSAIPLKTGAPVILVQPIYATNPVGTAIFTFTPSGTAPLLYQWLKNGANLVNGGNISGATNASLVITNLQVNESDSFTVLVSNAWGCAVSSPARFLSNLNAFNPGAGASSSIVYTAVGQTDGKIVVGGTFATLAGSARNYVGRLNPDGTLDSSLGVSPVSHVAALAMQPDGKILMGGYFKTLNGLTIKRIARLNADGSLETAFNPSINTPGSDYSSVRAIAVLTNQQILVGGDFTAISGVTRRNFGRINAAGSLDTSYALDADGYVLCIALQPDGKVLLGGSFTTLGGQTRNHIARLNADCSLDYLFAPGADGAVNAIAVQADGKILVGGQFSTLAGRSRSNLGRLNADGTVDDSFNPGANGPVNSLVVQPDTRIIAGGTFSTLGGQSLYNLGLLNPDGTVDARFRPWITGSSVAVNTMVLQSDKNLVVGGRFDSVDGIGRTNLCRLSVPDPLLLIVQQPTNATCRVGDIVSFGAMVEGVSPIFYQWLKNGLPLNDGSNTSGSATTLLTLTNVSMADAGRYSLVLTNSSGCKTSSVASLKVLMPFAPTNVTANPLPFGTVGRTYEQTMTASGGVEPYTWTISSGTLPTGLGLSNGGVLSGVPARNTNASFTVRVTGGNGAYAEDDFSLVIFTAPVITTPSLLPAGRTGRAYSQTLSGSGGVMPYSWDVVAGELPPGLSLGTDGVLGGTPTLATNASFSVRMTTANGVSTTNSFNLTIALEVTLLVEDFEHGGALPSGWTQEFVSGTVSWTAHQGGNGSPQNAHGGSYDALIYGSSGNSTKLVSPLIDFGTNTRAQITFWLDMKTYILSQDTVSVYYRTSSAAPWTLLQNYSYCSSWTQKTLDLPTPSRNYCIAFEGHTYGGYGVCIDDVGITGTSDPVPPTIVTGGELSSGTVGSSYQQTLQASGGADPYAWAIAAGSLPPGLTLNGQGLISGTPSRAGNFGFGVTVTGDDGYASTNQFNVAINPVSTVGDPTYSFTTFVGGSPGSADGTNDSAQFSTPTGVCIDSSNNLYVADSGNHTIRKVTRSGVVTLAGLAGAWGTNDGVGSAARFYSPRGLAVDTNNQIYVADQNNNTIRAITPGGSVYTLAGVAGRSGYDSTNGIYYFNHPSGITVGNGNCYVADTEFSTVVEIQSPEADLYLVAGWYDGYADGTNSGAKFLWPEGIVFSQGNLFVADTGNHLVRKATLDGVVTTLAGSPGISGSADGTNTTAQFDMVGCIAADSRGNLFVADRGNHTIRRITPEGVVTTIGGLAGSPGRHDDVGIAARFDSPDGITVDSNGVLYIADSMNNRIVKGTPILPPLLSIGNQGTLLTLSWPASCQGWELQAQTNGLGANWVTISGSTNNNEISLQPNTTGAAVFYRLHKP